MKRSAVPLLALLLAGHAAHARPPRPPRLPSSPRHFARTMRPVQPRTSVALQVGQLLGGTQQGVDPEQSTLGLIAELAAGRFGMFVDAALVRRAVRTEGVYGFGRSEGPQELADLRFGADARLLCRTVHGTPWALGLGLQGSAPTGGERSLQPATPLLPAPTHRFGPAAWSVGGGPRLAGEPGLDLALQLDLDLVGYLRDARDQPWLHRNWLFGAVALLVAYQRWVAVTPMLALDLQLEMYGRQPALRQLLFAAPALRLRPLPRLAVDLGLRVPLTPEAANEQRLSYGVTVEVGLGPEGDDAW